MITYTEFFLFIVIVLAGCYGMYWRAEAHKWNHLFKLMLTNEEARTELISRFKEFKERIG